MEEQRIGDVIRVAPLPQWKSRSAYIYSTCDYSKILLGFLYTIPRFNLGCGGVFCHIDAQYHVCLIFSFLFFFSSFLLFLPYSFGGPQL